MHRVSAWEFMQQESVEFGELAAQNAHKPVRLESNPQSLGSFSAPVIHIPESESAGSAQLVKSALI